MKVLGKRGGVLPREGHSELHLAGSVQPVLIGPAKIGPRSGGVLKNPCSTRIGIFGCGVCDASLGAPDGQGRARIDPLALRLPAIARAIAPPVTLP